MGSSWVKISSCVTLSFDPAELDLPLDNPPVTATSDRGAGAAAGTVLFSLRTGAGVELLLLNC